MPYKLMLDDDVDTYRAPQISIENDLWRESMDLPAARPPGHGIGDGWMLARSCQAAIEIVQAQGFPNFVSFDHDLGDGQDGKKFAEYLVELDLDTGTMPAGFDFEVHSGNYVGRENIRSYLENYLRIRGAR